MIVVGQSSLVSSQENHEDLCMVSLREIRISHKTVPSWNHPSVSSTHPRFLHMVDILRHSLVRSIEGSNQRTYQEFPQALLASK